MTIQYITQINKDLQDVTQTLIISYFITCKQETQFWKQIDLAGYFGLSEKTIERKLKDLKDNKYIDYKSEFHENEKTTKIILLDKAKQYILTNKQEETKKSVGRGRPKGYKVSAATKARISKGMKYYYANMTKEQQHIRNNCNRIKSELYRKAMQEYYHDLLN